MRLHEDKQLFSILIQETAQFIKLPEIYIEKDYWVTSALHNLSQSNYAKLAVFKGGTSLSKAYKLINRFSEDIDLAVHTPNLSDHQRKKLLRSIETAVSTDFEYIPKDERESKGSKFRRTAYKLSGSSV